MKDLKIMYVNVKDLGGEIHAESHLVNSRVEPSETHRFTSVLPYSNDFEQFMVMKKSLQSVMEQARTYQNELNRTYNKYID